MKKACFAPPQKAFSRSASHQALLLEIMAFEDDDDDDDDDDGVLPRRRQALFEIWSSEGPWEVPVVKYPPRSCLTHRTREGETTGTT